MPLAPAMPTQQGAMPLPHPMAPMYVNPLQGYAAAPEAATTTAPTGPQPHAGTTEGTAGDRVAGPAIDAAGMTATNVAPAQAVQGAVDPFTVGLGVPGMMGPW